MIGPVQSRCHEGSPVGKRNLRWEGFVEKVGFEPGVKLWKSEGVMDDESGDDNRDELTGEWGECCSQGGKIRRLRLSSLSLYFTLQNITAHGADYNVNKFCTFVFFAICRIYSQISNHLENNYRKIQNQNWTNASGAGAVQQTSPRAPLQDVGKFNSVIPVSWPI